jgi:hypothetical protein
MSSCLNPPCGKEFTPTRNTSGMYCSRSCAVTVNNSRAPKRKRNSPREKDCLECGNPLNYQAKFCSRTCSGAFKRARLIESWFLGSYTGSDANGLLSGTIRTYLIKEAGDKCTQCGWGTKNPHIDKVILTVDHIDGDWRNNRPENLVVLCYNCHTLTPTFGALNQNGLFSTRPGTYRRGAVDK